MHFSLWRLLIFIVLINSMNCKSLKKMILVRSQKMNDKLSPQKEDITQFQNAQFFQDIFLEHVSPLEIMFGHVCENPKEWEQRYEHKNMEKGIYQGKVRWGDKNGHYGEHYWDLNH